MTVKFADGSEIESTGGDGFIASGPTAMELIRLRMLQSTIELDLKGIKMIRGNVVRVAENIAGLKFGNGKSGREKALAWTIGRIEEIRGEGVVTA